MLLQNWMAKRNGIRRGDSQAINKTKSGDTSRVWRIFILYDKFNMPFCGFVCFFMAVSAIWRKGVNVFWYLHGTPTGVPYHQRSTARFVQMFKKSLLSWNFVVLSNSLPFSDGSFICSAFMTLCSSWISFESSFSYEKAFFSKMYALKWYDPKKREEQPLVWHN